MSNGTLGFLRTCIDKRFVEASRRAFETTTGLGSAAYWHEAYAGGSARDPSLVGNDPKTGNNLYADEYAAEHGAAIFGWGPISTPVVVCLVPPTRKLQRR